MANINLLPWREQQRKERLRATLITCGAMCLVAALIVGGIVSVMNARIQYQQDRNAYLQTEIDNLAKVIKEIENIKEKRDQLLSRMEVIQTLQSNRAQIVHVFDDLVQKLPVGVHYSSIEKSGGNITIRGRAQSNARVSALMRNLDSSDWFDNPSLNVVDVIDEEGAQVSQFNLTVKEFKKNAETDLETVN